MELNCDFGDFTDLGSILIVMFMSSMIFGVDLGSDFDAFNDLGLISVAILMISVIWGFRAQGRNPKI